MMSEISNVRGHMLHALRVSDPARLLQNTLLFSSRGALGGGGAVCSLGQQERESWTWRTLDTLKQLYPTKSQIQGRPSLASTGHGREGTLAVLQT